MAVEETIGNYRLLGELGRGGMGIIYKAEQVNLGRFVALKVLYPHLVSDPITVKRFNHEARATALLNHPNIVQIFDVGVEEDMHYFAMEYVPGKTLAAVLENRGKLGVEETLRIVDQVAAALSAASDVGIIHRDIKPSNILIDTRGLIKVSDFGIAVAAGTGELTDTGHLLGSVRYMSPEHARNEHLDSRTDLYALGIVVYEMLTGAPPFDGDSPLDVLKKHADEPPPAMPDTIPPVVQALVLNCLEKRRVDRHRTPRAFRQELRECVGEIDWQGPALPPLESSTTDELEPDPSFRYDRAGVIRSMRDTVAFFAADRLSGKRGFGGRIGRRIGENLGRHVRYRHDSYKLKRLEVMELRENLKRAEYQLEEAKRECDRAHEKYEIADEELHGWQMEGSLSLDLGKKFPKEAAAIQEKKLWQQATSYKLQWQSLQGRVRDWYQNVERSRRDYEGAVRELDLLRVRRRRVAEESGVAPRNRLRFILTLALLCGAAVMVLFYAGSLWDRVKVDADGARGVYGRFLEKVVMMESARDEHAAALLPSGDVLVAGGLGRDHSVLASAEVFHVSERRFRATTGGLLTARFNHTMVTLPDDAGVLVIGGERKRRGREAIRSVELFVESEGKFVHLVNLSVPRTRHRSILTDDGRVLVTGGANRRTEALLSAEIYERKRFRPTVGEMNVARKDHVMTLLADGRVLITGGSREGNTPVDTVEIFDPETERFTVLCSLVEARYEHTATALEGNRVLIVGGRKGQQHVDALDSMELIDLERKESKLLKNARLRLPRRTHTATVLPGTSPACLLIVGGAVDKTGRGSLCEKFVPGWKGTHEAGRLNHDRGNQTATVLADGSILFTGGFGRDAQGPLQLAEIYVKTTNRDDE